MLKYNFYKLLRFLHLISKKKYKKKTSKYTKEYKIVAKSKLFDANWYLEHNPDVKLAHEDPILHYLNHGWKEGRLCSPYIDSFHYIDKGIPPILYYEMYEKNCNPKQSILLPRTSDVCIDSKEDCVPDNQYNNFTNIKIIKKSSKNLIFPLFNSIQVSIIIPVYNNYYYTKLCLQSILDNTKDISYEVIIADDNSTDETKRIDKYVKNIKIIRNEENLRFLKNCNNAAKYAKGKYILFLNNDTQVQNNWLKPLVETIENDNKIGLVGSKLVYPDGTLQEAGGIIYRDASGCNYGRNDNPNALWYNYVKEVDYISGAAILLKRSLWNELGGFDETFAPAYYEDTDLAFQIRYKKDLKVVYVPQSVVVHFEGKSNGTDLSSGQKQYQVINRSKFYNKWKNELYANHSAPTTNNFLARDHAVNKKSILVIDWKILSFSKDTGSRTTYQYMKFFNEMGMNVKYFPHDWYIEDDYLQQHLNDGFEVIHQNFNDFIRCYGSQFDYVYLNRPNLAPFYIDALRKYTKAKILYQCHDLHYLRQYRTRLLTNELDALNCLDAEKRSEFEVFRKMDLVCTFSFDEVKEIKKESEYINVKQIPLYILDSNKMSDKSYIAQKRADIMFVAGFQHTPNIDAAVWFVKDIFPKIRKSNPNMKLYLVGSNPSKEVLDLQSKNVIVTGFVTEDQLNDFYSKVRLVVVPLRTGAGVKGKIIEAVYNKVPVVTTSIGIEGIDNSCNTICVKDTALELEKEIDSLYRNCKKLNEISNKSVAFIENNFSKNAAKKAFENYMEFDNEI